MSEDVQIGEQELRDRTRALLARVHPDDEDVDSVKFRGALYDAGLAWLHFPEGYGGLGLSPGLQAVVTDEVVRNAKTTAYLASTNVIGVGMAAPTLLAHASEEMKKTLLRRIFTAEDIWCQLFSEPGAGSDVAGLSCRAVRDGDEWVVNGQKIWTSSAHLSKWGLLLARTDPDVPKHDGLSYFALDMHTPGVDVRPLYQITGQAEFNEVFLTDVRIPQERMLGREGQGWRVAITTLMNERVAIGGIQAPGWGRTRPLIELWKASDKSGLSSVQQAILRDRIAKIYIEAELLGLTSQRAKAAQLGGTPPGPEGSVCKLAQAELNKRLGECALDVIGSGSLVYEPGYERGQERGFTGDAVEDIKYQFLRGRANSIEGGTSEIMRNILGERVLGLPGEPRVDKGIPWKDVPRG